MVRSQRPRGNASRTFQPSISAATLSPEPPYGRYFSVPIPVVHTEFHNAVKRIIQKQKSLSFFCLPNTLDDGVEANNEINDEGDKNADLKTHISSVNTTCEEEELKAKSQELTKKIEDAKVEAKIIREREEKRENELLLQRKKDNAIEKEKKDALVAKQIEIKTKLSDLKKSLKQEEEELSNLIMAEKQDDERANINRQKRKRYENKEHAEVNHNKFSEEANLSTTKKQKNSHPSSPNAISPEDNTEEERIQSNNVSKETSGDSFEEEEIIDVHQPNMSQSNEAGSACDEAFEESSYKSEIDKLNKIIKDMKSDLDEMKITKSEMAWLLKEIITEEKKRKEEAKKTRNNVEVENKLDRS